MVYRTLTFSMGRKLYEGVRLTAAGHFDSAAHQI